MITTEVFAEQLLSQNLQIKKENAVSTFMKKMNAAEKSVMEQGLISEEDVEIELSKI